MTTPTGTTRMQPGTSTADASRAMMQTHLAALWPPRWRAACTTRHTHPFLVTSYPDATQAPPDTKPPWISSWSRIPSDLEAVIQRTLAQSQTHDVYFSVNLGHPTCQGSPRTRLKKRDVFVVPGLLGDFDGAWGQHKEGDHVLPETMETLVAFLHRLPTPPTLIIDTGGGCHSYHLFPEPLVLETAEDRTAFETLATRFEGTVERWAQEQHGWKSNGIFTSDMARVLRLCGSINHKYQTVVTLLEDTGRRYRPAELGAWLDPPTVTRRPRASGSTPTAPGTLDLLSLATHYGMALADRADGELCGSHPVHGSDTGTNVSLNPATQVWHCFRHSTGGGALDFLAVCEGLLACANAKPGGLRGLAYVNAVTLANDQWQAGIVLDERQARQEAQDAADNALAAGLADAGPPAAPPTEEPPPQEAGPPVRLHVLPDYLANHPDARVRKHWQRLYQRTNALKRQLAREGALYARTT